LWAIVSRALAAAGAAVAVKLMDDELDRERDAAAGFPNLAARLQRGTTAYALAALCLGCAAAAATAVPLVLAAYAVGMGRDATRQPSGLPGWLEGLLALAVVALAFGPRRAAAAVAAVTAIQLTDDWVDWRADAGYRHGRLPRPANAALAVAAWTAAAALDPLQAAAVAVAGGVIAWLTRRART
jgi:hypothetical protein